MGQHLAFVRSVPKTPSVNWEQKFSHGKKSEVWDFLLFQKISKIPLEFFPSSAFVRKRSLTCKNLKGITQALDLPVHPLRSTNPCLDPSWCTGAQWWQERGSSQLPDAFTTSTQTHGLSSPAGNTMGSSPVLDKIWKRLRKPAISFYTLSPQ